ncbi:MAG: TfoX/Sxy family protein [Gammaproteobacteria bacterium]|nr:TfoX/Sxy family protein [Gammaproteobacteria bacterium]
MAFNEALASSVRTLIAGQRGVVEKKMFGGVAFLINGNMSVGVHGNELIVRIPPETTDAALKEPGARLFDITGRPMKGWLLVDGAEIKNSKSLAKWVNRGVEFAFSLPKKQSKAR